MQISRAAGPGLVPQRKYTVPAHNYIPGTTLTDSAGVQGLTILRSTDPGRIQKPAETFPDPPGLFD